MIYTQTSNREKIQALLTKLRQQDALSLKEYKELLERTHSFLLRNSENDADYNLCLSVICHVGDKKIADTLIRQLLVDCIVQSRVYLYTEMTGFENIDKFVSDFDIISKELYTLEKSDTVLTRDQKVLFDFFQTKRRIVVSAPTSFGKSRIVQELIIHNDLKTS